ncbi:hypothetical protein LTR28_010638 [Elasticomyces elasticus]|nr:hypothetical protein LTR28_010638 [Elasticomyces elasticus]
MKIPTLALALLTLVLPLTTPVLADNLKPFMACHTRAPAIANGIVDFCRKSDIVVPSRYASNGKVAGDAVVRIVGHACPPGSQWVPQQYCQSQFFDICNTHQGGLGSARYGRDGCQFFTIQRK